MLVLTDRRGARYPLTEVVAGAVAGGARWVVLREKDLRRDERLALAEDLRAILAPAGGRLIVAGPDPLDGEAVHLAAGDPLPARPGPSSVDRPGPSLVDRPGPSLVDRGPSLVDGTPVPSAMAGLTGRSAGDIEPRPSAQDSSALVSSPDRYVRVPSPQMLVGRSCHNADELERLSIEDYATLSPVYPSASKPGYGPPLGTERFGWLAARTARPVLALGGIETPERAAACVAAGAAGVAVMGAVMRAADPRAAVAALLEEVAA